MHWFIKARRGHENGVNTYLMTMISRIPRQILGFTVDKGVKSERIQQMVDDNPIAENYYTDGSMVYLDVYFYDGCHKRNIHDKKDTHIIESVNADLRHYISGLRRKSRCFFRSMETLKAVLYTFINAYNKFGEAKLKCRMPVDYKSQKVTNKYHKFRYPTFSVLDFIWT